MPARQSMNPASRRNVLCAESLSTVLPRIFFFCTCGLPVSFNESVHPPKTFSIKRVFLPSELPLTGCFFLYCTILRKLWTLLCVGILGMRLHLRFQNQRIWKAPAVALHSKSIRKQTLSMLVFRLTVSEPLDPYLHAVCIYLQPHKSLFEGADCLH